MNANIFQYTQMKFAHLADISRRTIRDNDIFQIPGEGVPKYPLERKFQRERGRRKKLGPSWGEGVWIFSGTTLCDLLPIAITNSGIVPRNNKKALRNTG